MADLLDGLDVELGVDLDPLENDAFEYMLMNWTSTSPYPRVCDTVPEFDRFSSIHAQTGESLYEENLPFPNASAGHGQNGNSTIEPEILGLHKSNLTTDPDISQPHEHVPDLYSSKSQHDGAFATTHLSPVSVTRQLAQLSTSLAEHAATIPPHSIHDEPHTCFSSPEHNQVASDASISEPAIPSGRPPKCVKCYGQGWFSIEETFRLTEELVDLYPRFVNGVVWFESPKAPRSVHLRHNGTSILDSPNSQTHDQSTSASTSNSTADDGHSPPDSDTPSLTFSSHQSKTAPNIDHASMFLILSCHHRLIDIWEIIIGHLRIKTKKNSVFGQSRDVDSRCAQLRIGSYVPSATSATSMYLMLIVELAEKLLEHVKGLVDEISGEASSKASSVDLEVASAQTSDGDSQSRQRKSRQPLQKGRNAHRNSTVMAGEAVVERAREMVKQICDIRRQLLSPSG